MKYLVHEKEIEYHDEECGFFKFNGIIWDYIPFDAKMFIEGLNDIEELEAVEKVSKMFEAVKIQEKWTETPKPTIKSSFIEVKEPMKIDLVRDKVRNTRVLLERILGLLGR